jgi:hypothetical protein
MHAYKFTTSTEGTLDLNDDFPSDSASDLVLKKSQGDYILMVKRFRLGAYTA